MNEGRSGITTGKRLKELFDEIDEALDIDSIGKVSREHIDALLKEQRSILSEMASRNIYGRELEKSGRVEEAIKLYEQNVVEEYDTPFPYKRLSILYHKQKRFDDEARVN